MARERGCRHGTGERVPAWHGREGRAIARDGRSGGWRKGGAQEGSTGRVGHRAGGARGRMELWGWAGGRSHRDFIQSEEEEDGTEGNGDAEGEAGDLVSDDDREEGEVDEANARVQLCAWVGLG